MRAVRIIVLAVSALRVLVTGDGGLIGRDIASALRGRGDTVIGFERARGDDVLDAPAVAQAADKCDVVVHCAAIKNDSRGTPAEIFATNVTGTWNVLRAAEQAGVSRFVYLSSAQVFGVFDPGVQPAHLPIDDDHPRNASRPYGLSKRFGEDLCVSVAGRTGMTVVALRPVAVYDAATFRWAAERSRDRTGTRWQDRSFVDVRDVVGATLLAMSCPPGCHVGLTLCADAAAPAADSDVVSAFDTSAASRVLGWQPEWDWATATSALGLK